MTLRKLDLGALALLLLPAACSDPKPPTPRGSLFTSIAPASVAEYAGKCNLDWTDGADAVIGGDLQKQLPDKIDPSRRVTDDEGGAKVSCKVAGSAAAFSISGNMSQGAVTFTVTGSVPSKSNGSGTIYLKTTATVGNALEPIDGHPCIFRPVEVATGRVWSEFDCPVLRHAGQTAYCAALGVFVFENCAD
jgi:hypothetical protein